MKSRSTRLMAFGAGVIVQAEWFYRYRISNPLLYIICGTERHYQSYYYLSQYQIILFKAL